MNAAIIYLLLVSLIIKILTLAVLVKACFQADDLGSDINKRLDDMEKTLQARIDGFLQVFKKSR